MEIYVGWGRGVDGDGDRERARLLSRGAGRLIEDGIWTYTWDGAGRLTAMTTKSGLGSFLEAGVIFEMLEFAYDAEGRRTRKQRTVVYFDRADKVETSRVLWAGWLPVM